MGATNRPDLLDPALLRPGRFDRLVYLGVNPADQSSILVSQMRKLRLEGDVTEIAQAIVPHLPPNLTGADLSTIPSGALLRATERLCQEADQDLLLRSSRLKTGDPAITIDDVLASWSEERLEPTVTLDDLLYAARKVVPSVSIDELRKYELLGENYKMTT
jgi:peroxin-6